MHASDPTDPLDPPTLLAASAVSVASTLRALGSTPPSDVWRSAAAALLRVSPRECETLAGVFEDERSNDDLRMRVLDLLAAAGTLEAQVVMRRVLALAIARRDSRTFAAFVQRLAMIASPDGPTLRFLMSVYAESRAETHDVRAACAYALGVATGHARSCGEHDSAVRASEVIRRDLSQAASVPEKCALVTALGNAGFVTDLALLLRASHDVDASVRAASALALRKLDLADARARLVALLADAELKVASSALTALSEHNVDVDELEVVAQLVLAGRVPAALDDRVLRFIAAPRGNVTSSSPRRTSAVESALRLLLGRTMPSDRTSGAYASGAVAIASGARPRSSAASLASLGLDVEASRESIPPPPPPPRPGSVPSVAVRRTESAPRVPQPQAVVRRR